MSKRLLFFVFILSFFNPIASYCAVTSNGVAHPISISQKKDAKHAFKMQHRIARVENFMAKHGTSIFENNGFAALFLLVVVGLLIWLASKIPVSVTNVAIPIILIGLGVFLIYALYRYGSGKKTLFKNY